jgi:hypothetical protein
MILGALPGIAGTAMECELTREFGVEWMPRVDGRGNELPGVTQAQMDAYSTRNVPSSGEGTQTRAIVGTAPRGTGPDRRFTTSAGTARGRSARARPPKRS